MSWACFWNFLLAGILALTVSPLTGAVHHTGLLGIFAALDAVAFVLVWLFVPGTAEVTTLEEMNYVFGVPTERHVRYQIYTVLPWLLDYILHPRKAVKLVPLYKKERRRHHSDSASVESTE